MASADSTQSFSGPALEDDLGRAHRTIGNLLRNLPGMAYRCRNDRAWTMEFVSEGCVDLTGHPPGDLIDNRTVSYNDLIHPDDRETIRSEVVAALREHRRFQIQYRIRTADGRERWVWEQGVGAEGDETGYVEGFVTDIGQLKAAQFALAKSEERFRELAELLPEIVYEMNLDGVLTFVNRPSFAKTGYTQVDIEKGFRAEWLIVPEERDRLRRNVERIVREGMGSNEYTAMRKDGKRFPVLTRSTVIVQDGEAVGLRGIIIDITEQKRAQERLRQTQKMEAIGMLAGGIAHDFNNLLTGILGYASLLQRKADDAERVRRAAGVIQTAAERASELTQQLLGFARKGKHDVKPVDLHAMLDEIAHMLTKSIDPGVTVSCRLDSQRHAILGDPTQIRQVFLNLADNAVDAMPGGGELVFRTVDVAEEGADPLAGADLDPGRYIRIDVTDTGHGISPERLPRVFEPFFTTKERSKGTGMGLPMVYGIVKNHGGDVTVSSDASGARFSIYLPSIETEEHVEDNGTGGANESATPGSGVVLLVDDEPVVRNVAGDILETLGYEVLVTAGGHEAVDLFREHADRIDLAIIDMVMPRMSGRECFMALRGIDPQVKALLSTGYNFDSKAADLMDLGMAGFIQKPYEADRLARAVHQVLKEGGSEDGG